MLWSGSRRFDLYSGGHLSRLIGLFCCHWRSLYHCGLSICTFCPNSLLISPHINIIHSKSVVLWPQSGIFEAPDTKLCYEENKKLKSTNVDYFSLNNWPWLNTFYSKRLRSSPFYYILQHCCPEKRLRYLTSTWRKLCIRHFKNLGLQL